MWIESCIPAVQVRTSIVSQKLRLTCVAHWLAGLPQPHTTTTCHLAQRRTATRGLSLLLAAHLRLGQQRSSSCNRSCRAHVVDADTAVLGISGLSSPPPAHYHARPSTASQRTATPRHPQAALPIHVRPGVKTRARSSRTNPLRQQKRRALARARFVGRQSYRGQAQDLACAAYAAHGHTRVPILFPALHGVATVTTRRQVRPAPRQKKHETMAARSSLARAFRSPHIYLRRNGGPAVRSTLKALHRRDGGLRTGISAGTG